MTILAYDMNHFACDSWITADSGTVGTCRKYEVWAGKVLATTGAADHGEALLVWYKEGCKPGAFPKETHDHKDAYLYVFEYDRPIQCFQTWPTPVIFHNQLFAAGCAKDIALAAMHCGKTAPEAAALACQLNCYCGGGVESVDLRAVQRAYKAATQGA